MKLSPLPFLLALAMLLGAASPGPRPPVELKRPTAAFIKPPKRPDPKVAKALQAELTKARAALTVANYASTVETLERALRLAREQSALEVTRLTVVKEIPEGLGMFQPTAGAQVFGGLLRLYAEVRNFVPRQVDGGYEVELVTDAYFYYEDGEFIAGSQGIGEHKFVASTRHEVTFMAVELHTTGLPPQPYHVELVITDKVSGKQARARAPFTVISEG